MKKLYSLFLILLTSTLSYGQITELYISKYGEGSSNNKFLEIYNGTGASVNLDNYAFPNVSNAPNVPGSYEFWNSFPPGATIADGDVFVIAHSSANAAILAEADMTFNFLSNGDDGFALVANDGTWNDANGNMNIDEGEMTGFTILDWLGNWDGDPGNGWDVAGVPAATQDHTLTRKSSVCGPNNDWAASAGTDASNSEWIVGAIDSGWGTIGSYVGCSTAPGISINSPGNGAELAWGTTDVDITFSTENEPMGATVDITVTINGGSANTTNSVTSPFNINPTADGDSIEVTVELIDGGVVASDTITFTIQATPPTLPYYDGFDYVVGTNVEDQTFWTRGGAGDDAVINSGNLSYTGLPASSGQSVSFDGGGSESYLEFLPVNSGSVYASFIFEVNDQSSITDLTDGGYFAAIAGGATSYDARMWVRPNPDAASSTFDIGFGFVSSNPEFTMPAASFNLGDDIFVVMSYNLDTSTISAWINPDSSDFEGSEPAATITAVDTAPPSSLFYFVLRQDSTGETPAMVVDELRLGTTWAEVTPTTLSVNAFNNESLKLYPNPVSDGQLNINSTTTENISVRVFDILGKEVISEELTNNSLDVSRLNAGLYIVKLTQGNATVTKKLIIE